MSTATAAAKHLLTKTSSLGPKLTSYTPLRSLALQCRAAAMPSFSAAVARSPSPAYRLNFSTTRAYGQCYNCGSPKHYKRECPLPAGTQVCNNCGEAGHRSNACSQPSLCNRCGQPGHKAAACSEPKKCYRCGSEDHQKANCPEAE